MGLAIASVFVTLVIAELVLRIVDAARRVDDRRGLHQPRPDRPWLYGLRPGAVGTLEVSGDTLYRINSAGFRDRDRAQPKPPGVFRILVLGDSVGFGYGVVAESADGGASTWLFAFFLLISLMHFWYDSFIWSVARKQV